MKDGINARFLQRCLDKSTFLKKDYENLLKIREAKKLKPQYTIEEKIELLIECTNLNERVPYQKETYKECNVGKLWQHMKEGINARFLQRCLDKSTFLKKDYENLLKIREANKLKSQYTIKEKIELLIECTNLNERVPYVKEMYKECKVGQLWNNMKNGQNARFLQRCQTNLVS